MCCLTYRALQLLLDWELEDMVATELLDTVKPRESSHLLQLPVFIVSGDDHSDKLDDLRPHGVKACWLKPVSADQLQTLVDDHAATTASEGASGEQSAHQPQAAPVQADPP